jgi:hypothetical protein
MVLLLVLKLMMAASISTAASLLKNQNSISNAAAVVAA